MLGVLLHAPSGPFYIPNAARSRWRSTWKAILAFCRVAHQTVRCTTGHEQYPSGARSLSFSDEAGRWIFRSVGAPDTVWCDYLTVGSATCRSLIAQTTVGHGRRWLTGQSGVPSPVNFSRDAFSFFPRATSLSPKTWARALRTHRTVRCTTGQSGDF
jgi:hypothetical protein